MVRPKLLFSLEYVVVADADQGVFQQVDDGRQDLFARQAALAHIGRDALADGGQRLAEVEHAFVLRAVAHLAPARMVAVLLAAPVVAAGRLDVAFGVGADPDIGIGRRDRQRFDAGQRFLVLHGGAVGIAEAEALARPAPPDAGFLVRDIDQPGLLGRGGRIDYRAFFAVFAGPFAWVVPFFILTSSTISPLQ